MENKTDVQANENASEKEIERRISLLESQTYEFPKRFSKEDYIFTALFVAVCLAFVIAGAFIL